MWRWCAIGCAFAIAHAYFDIDRARAGSVTLDNGITGEGFTSVSPDDFGTYGFLIGQQFDDEFYAAGVGNPFTPTYLTGPMLFVTTPDNVTSAILLTEYRFWADFVEDPPPMPDGLAGGHAQLTRTVTTPITAIGTQATSAFRIAAPPSNLLLDFTLVQQLSSATPPNSQLDQIYTVTNNGSVAVDIVFHVAWDPDLYYNPSNQETDDIVGIAPGTCGAYMTDGDPRWSIALGNGPTSTVPLAYYFAGKEGHVPGAGPAFAPISAPIENQHIWIERGMPVAWRNYGVGPGYDAVGESPTTLDADATIGTEYRFALPANTTETIHVRRYYGTIAIPCYGNVSPSCGNGTVDPGESCDGADTPTCNGTTCMPSMCGDGYPNAMADEDCDTGGVDSASCNAATCTTPTCGDGYVNALANEMCDDGAESATCNADCSPAACGDGYVNVAADEQCETGELCDPACRYTFTLGGGCAGCSSSGEPGIAWLLVGISLVLRRNGRRWRRRDQRKGETLVTVRASRVRHRQT